MITKNSKPNTIKPKQIAARDKYNFRLYIAGQTPGALAALRNLKLICEERLKGKYRIEVIDIKEKPQICHDDQILAIPTLMRKTPLPVRFIIGDLSNTERLLTGLGLTLCTL